MTMQEAAPRIYPVQFEVVCPDHSLNKGQRVIAYAFLLVTDRYPPFRLAA
jgi:hypothetical protein